MSGIERCLVLFVGLLLAATAAIGEDHESGLLWKIAGKNNHLYLLGSVHMLRESDFPLAASIEAAYQDAETLVMELDMDDLNPLAVQALFFTYGRLPEDKTLQQVMGAEQWAYARRTAEALDIDLMMLNQIKPWWAALTVAQLQLTRLGFDPEHGIEAYFAQRAASDDKPIEGLETADYQVRLFDAMDTGQQTLLLVKSLDDAATLERDMGELLSAWREGRADELARMQSETFREFPALYGSLIRARNENWVRALAPLLTGDERDYLVVVGALHLVGEDSVVKGLEALGYRATRQ